MLVSLALVGACGGGGPDQDPEQEGTYHLFAWGAAGPDDGPVKLDIMRDSLEGVVSAFSGSVGDRSVINQSMDADVVTGDWVRAQLESYAETLAPGDTFVWYAHTHGGDVGLPVVGIRWVELTDMLLDLPADDVVVFMMSCHSGRLVEQMDAVSGEWSGRADEGRNLLVFSAVGADELSGAVEGVNPFAAAVSGALAGEADGGGAYLERPESWDGDTRFSGAVSMEELNLYVPYVTRRLDPAKNPMSTGSYDPLVVFLPD